MHSHRLVLCIAAILLMVPVALHAQTRQLEVVLPVAQAAALTRVQSVFADDGLAITSGTVVEGEDTDRLIKLRYHAAVVAVDSARSRVVLTAFGSRPGMGILPEANAQVTSKTSGAGKKAWARLERLRAALARDATTR